MATHSTGATGDTAEPVEPVDVCGHAVPPARDEAGRRLAGVIPAGDAWWRTHGVGDSVLGWNGAAGDFDGDGHADLAVEHILPDSGISVFFGPLMPGTWDETQAAAYAIVPTPATADLRFGVTDVDLDGSSELLFYSQTAGNWTWEVLDLVPGLAGLVETSSLPPPQGAVDLTPWDLGAVEGLRWSSAADANADGQPDLWLTTSDEGIGEWFVKLLPGPMVGVRDPLLESVAAYDLLIDAQVDQTYLPKGEPDNDVLAVGAFGGDDTPDLAFAVEGTGPLFAGYGGVVWVLDPPLVTATIEDVLTAYLDGNNVAGRFLGLSSGVLAVPDMNGDGYDEAAFTAEGDPSVGGVVLMQYGPPPAGTYTEDCVPVTLTDGDPYGQAANEVMTGDLDGDDVPDLVAHGVDTWVFYGPVATGVTDVADADAILPGAMPLGIADFDEDGSDDVALGWAFGAGEAYILLGGWQ